MAFNPLYIGDGIVLALVQPEDAGEIFALVNANRGYLREWLPWVDRTHDVQDILAFVERAGKQDEDKNSVQCSIRLDGKIVGVTGFVIVDHSNRKCAVSYWISQSCQGSGITTKAVWALTEYAFSNWKMNRVEITAGEANVKSRAVAERLGFTYEGDLREAEWVNDRYVDHAVYSMLKHDWRSLSGDR